MNLATACDLLGTKDKKILAIILSGSRARGDYRKDSDYDLTMVINAISKSWKKECSIKRRYENFISTRTKIPSYLLQVAIWPKERYNLELQKGHSFLYCALRDGKILFSRKSIVLKQPKSCQKAGYERIRMAKLQLDLAKDFSKAPLFNSTIYKEHLGYCAMHLCWAVCMIHNFCPRSKYTVLKECQPYFTSKQFTTIQKAYLFYVNPYRRSVGKTRRELKTKLQQILNKLL